MLPDETIDLITEVFADQWEAMNRHYLELLGAQIKELETLTPTAMHRLQQMMRTGANINTLEQELAALTGKTLQDIQKVLERAALENYTDAEPYYQARRISQVPLADNLPMMRVIRAIERQTLTEWANLSQTTLISQTYRNALDEAIGVTQRGLTDYKTAMRDVFRKVAADGLRVTYPSGRTTRLDAAVRMNVLDGTRAINQGVQDEIGREVGADGKEISAHANSAPDHAPYQGKQFTKEEYEELQASLPRPFGKWNCHHFTFSIILGISTPAHTARQMRAMQAQNDKGVTYNGNHYTGYEATQEQRRMELAMRYGRDLEALARAAGDVHFANDVRRQVGDISAEYKAFSTAAGLTTRMERARRMVA